MQTRLELRALQSNVWLVLMQTMLTHFVVKGVQYTMYGSLSTVYVAN